MVKYVAEPFKIKMVEPMKMTTREERIEKLKAAKLQCVWFRLR